jgi:hypothetical protein
MDTLAHLTKVLPEEGIYVGITINPGDQPRQKFFHEIADLAAFLKSSSDRGDNVYFATAAFKEWGSRKQDNVRALKSFYMDVDCGPGKPFGSWKAGLAAVGKFVSETGLPAPMIVASGNGLHVYWVLEDEATPDEWKPVAHGLKALVPHFCGITENGKPVFDPAVPADSARVLRACGTMHPSAGKEVKLLIDAPATTIDELKDVLAGHDLDVPAAVIVTRKSNLLDAMSTSQDSPPSDPDAIISKCAQVRWAVENQADVSEPFWYALLGVAAYCADPVATAVAWSKDHPSFDEATTIKKMEQWRAVTTGPATCARFNQERPSGCRRCPVKARVTSPVQLGVAYATVDVAPDAPDEPTAIAPIPKPYKRTAKGIVVSVDGVDIVICPFDLYPMSYGRDEVLGYEVVRFRWNRTHIGWQELVLRQALLNDDSREFSTAIADQGILLDSKAQIGLFRAMLRTYMQELRQLKSMTNLYGSMGWKENHTQFLLGNTLYRRLPDGSVEAEAISLAGLTQSSIDDMFCQKGTRDAWIKLTELLESAKLHAHMFSIGLGLAAPLYTFSGIAGVVINLYGPTGAGKTLAQLLQQSLWGNPRKLHYSARFTPNAMFNRLGFFNHLPFTIDETTMLPSKEIGDFLYGISQGRDKARLTKHVEERAIKTWSTVVTTSSNKSLGSMLVLSGMETDAQQARLLDVPLGVNKLFSANSKGGELIYQTVMDNYGHIGPELLRHYMSMGPEGIAEALALHKARFLKKYGVHFVGHERYWEQAIITADFANEQASQLGLVRYNYEEGTREILRVLGLTRAAMKDSAVDAFDLIGEYLNECAGSTLTMMYTGAAKGVPDYNRMPREGIIVRLDVYRQTQSSSFDRGTIMVDRKHFRKWLATHGHDYRLVSRELSDAGALSNPPNNKCYMGRGTSIRLPQIYVMGFNLAHPRLKGILTEVENELEAQAVSSLKVVK